MIAVDTNLLVYAHRGESHWHAQARRALTSLAVATQPWAIPWPCVHEFLAVATHPRVFDPPSTLDQAFAELDAWLGAPSVHLLGEGDVHLDHLRQLTGAANAVGPRVHDARIAAICLGNGVSELWSADRDFSRFHTLRVRNPLVAGIAG